MSAIGARSLSASANGTRSKKEQANGKIYRACGGRPFLFEGQSTVKLKVNPMWGAKQLPVATERRVSFWQLMNERGIDSAAGL